MPVYNGSKIISINSGLTSLSLKIFKYSNIIDEQYMLLTTKSNRIKFESKRYSDYYGYRYKF